ncbi:MAG: polysaccharide deacetylase family protein [Hyphomicrobiales bacterium]|nr:polysaccharide deacetylase family protein [Hyphomicrobiales bacterium]
MLVTTSWDDGHPSDLRVADLLEKHGLRGTFYVPSANCEGRPVMSGAQVVALGRRFEIGGHTKSHVDLTTLAPDRIDAEVRSNKARLEDFLGREVPGFAYVRGGHNRVVRSLVAQAGYRYARTIKSLMSAPGRKRLQVPTTAQFFPHKRSTYLKNYVSGGPSLQRSGLLRVILREEALAPRILAAAAACASGGGFFHLWGHSWELDQHDLWSELDHLLARLGALDARYVTNATWCASLIADTSRPTARDARSEKPA